MLKPTRRVLKGCASLVAILGCHSIQADQLNAPSSAQTAVRSASTLPAPSAPPGTPSDTPAITAPVTITPEQALYAENQAKIKAAIVQKNAEIQSVQQKIDQTIYPAQKPPLEAQKAALQKQLNDLLTAQQVLEASPPSQVSVTTGPASAQPTVSTPGTGEVNVPASPPVTTPTP